MISCYYLCLVSIHLFGLYLIPISSSYPVHIMHFQGSMLKNTVLIITLLFKNIPQRLPCGHLCCLPLSLSFKVLHDLVPTHFQDVILQLFPFMDSMFCAAPCQLGNLCLQYSSPTLPKRSLSTFHDPAYKSSPKRNSLSCHNLHGILYLSYGFCYILPYVAGLTLKLKCVSFMSRKNTLPFLALCSLRSL